MRFRNTTDWDDHFVRRMLRWTAGQVELPSGRLREARFTGYARGPARGRAWSSGRLLVRVGNASWFPYTAQYYKRACRAADGTYPVLADRLEALVHVTAHELQHVVLFARGVRGRGHEDAAEAMARKVLAAFREQRDVLEREWFENPPRARAVEPKLGIQERNALRAAKKLAEWTRKLRLAQGKVRKYKQTVARYERVAALKQNSN